MGNLVKHTDKQICLRGSSLPAIEKPLAMDVEEMIVEEMVSEEIVMEEMVMEEMVMEEMVMEEVVLVMQDSYCHVGSMLAQTRPEVPMAEE